MTTMADERAASAMRWGRILVGGILLEGLLLLVAVPILAFMPNPFMGVATTGPFTLFFVSIAAACFVVGMAGGWWVGRAIDASRALHGALAGSVATLIYLAICSVPPNSLAIVAAAYGLPVFVAINLLRIAGAVAGATVARR